MGIQLKRLELTNYRNIDYAQYDFNGSSVIIGENRIGKTNILESIYWLLTDKLLDGSSDSSSIKPLKDTKLQVSVKATFLIDDEKTITIEKQYGENWVKTRGTDTLSFQGHYLKYFYNGIKQNTVKSFKQLFFEDFKIPENNYQIDIIQMLINPYYLGNLGEDTSWTMFREFIIKLVGDIKDDDVFKEDETLSKIKDDLLSVNGRFDQLKKKYVADIDSCKQSLVGKQYQVQILEQTKRPTDDEITIAKKSIEEHENRISSLKVVGIDNASIMIQEKINAKESELNDLKKECLEKSSYNSEKDKLSSEIFSLRIKQSDLFNEKNKILNSINAKNMEIENNKIKLSKCQNVRQECIKKLLDIDDKIKNPVIETVCPNCGRPYEEDQIDFARQSEIERLKKSKEEILKVGTDNKKEKSLIESKIIDIESEIKNLNDNYNVVDSSLSDILNQIRLKETQYSNLTPTDVVENPMIESLKNEIEMLKKDLKDSKDNFFKGQQDNQQLIYNEQQAMIPFKNLLADYDHYQRNMELLNKINQEISDIQKVLMDLEQKKELLSKFNLLKLNLLNKNVSTVFGNIKFQLFKENINGGYDNVCKPYIFDETLNESTTTTWKNGSKSERIATGIAIIERIKKNLQLPDLPILFDEGGEVSNITFAERLKTDSQIICVKIVDDILKPIVSDLKR